MMSLVSTDANCGEYAECEERGRFLGRRAEFARKGFRVFQSLLIFGNAITLKQPCINPTNL